MTSKVLITGTAGFIGFHLARRLLTEGYEVVGLDNINNYYDVNLKFSRLKETGILRDKIEYGKLIKSSLFDNYSFIKCDLCDKDRIDSLFKEEKFEKVINLAAQAGVRYSLDHPLEYINSNIVGFVNILEACRHNKIKHLLYASSSSVYGLNEKMPFSTSDNVDHPISLYAASKKSDELIAHTYSYLFKLPTTGLRFFTVYGPWGRPDMALFIFTKAIIEGKSIDIYNNGDMLRDFTYVSDVVNSLTLILEKIPEPDNEWSGSNPDPGFSPAPYKVYNIGNCSPVRLIDFISAIENYLGKKAIRKYLPLQAGDVPATWADVEELFKKIQYKPATTIKSGIKEFIDWYIDYVKENDCSY